MASWPVAIEVIDAQVVVEQVRDAALEEVELRDRIFPHRDQEAHAQVATVDGARRTRPRRCPSPSSGVIEKVLLELIEDDQQVAVDASPSHDCSRSANVAPSTRDGQSPARSPARGRERIVAPGPERRPANCGVPRRRAARGGFRAQVVSDAGVEHRALADAARAVEQRQARAIRLAVMISRSASRPKKKGACSSVKGISPA